MYLAEGLVMLQLEVCTLSNHFQWLLNQKQLKQELLLK